MAQITVTGTIKDVNGGLPSIGSIKFELSNEMTNSSGTFISRAANTSIVNPSNGNFSVVLESTTDSVPNDRTYKATFVGVLQNIYTVDVLGTFALTPSPSSQVLNSIINSLPSTTVAISSAATIFLQAGTGAVVRTVQDKLRDTPISVKDFQAIGDGITDDTIAIQTAINSLPNTGGTVYLPPGTYLISSTLTIGKDNIVLQGAGASTIGNIQPSNPNTQLKWKNNDAGTMVSLSATTGSSNPSLRRAGLVGMALNCNNGFAGTAVNIKTLQYGFIRDLTILQPATYGMDIGVVAAPLSDVRDTQNCDFSNICILSSVATSDAICIRLTGDAQLANASYNVFRNLTLSGKNNPEISINNADNNEFYDTRCFHSGSGKSVDINQTGATTGYTNNNIFRHLTPQAGLEQRGFATQNVVFEYDRSQGYPGVTVTAGTLISLESLITGAGQGIWYFPPGMTFSGQTGPINIDRLSVNGTNAGTNEISSVRSQLNAVAGDVAQAIKVTDSASNAKLWDIFCGAVTLTFRAVSDAYAAATNYMVVTRNAAASTILSVTFPSGNVGMGSGATPNTSASLDLLANDHALLLNRMTSTQRDALTPADGMLIYNTTTGKFQGREAGAWVNLV